MTSRSILGSALHLGVLLLPLVTGCSGGSSTDGDPVPTAGTGGQAGKSGASGSSGQAGTAGSGGSGGSGGKAGAAGVAGTAGIGGAAGTSAGASGAGAAGEAGAGGESGASGAGAGGESGSAGAGAGTAGAAGSATGCEGQPGLGDTCSSGLQGVCAVGHNKCIQGAISCVPDVGPGEQVEVCDGLDNDCDGETDEGLPKNTYFIDADKDGFGSTATQQACSLTAGLSEFSTDCNDSNPSIHPGATETCNDVDDNCNGTIDEGVQKLTFFKDTDGDGFGGTSTTLACTAPAGYVADSGDCNDFNKDIYPGAPESCNNVDDNCNGLIDDGLPLVDVFTDLDGDGHGGKNALAKKQCLIGGTDAQTGFSTKNDDCDDSKSTVYPGAPELCDGVLNNCSLTVADYQCPTKCAGSWPASIGGGYGYVSFAQLDSDAELEVITSQGGVVYAFEHDGSLKWKSQGGLGTSYGFPSLADFDHDGILDVASTYSGKVHLLRGTDGNLIASVNSPSASAYYATTIYDLDHNGWPDLVPTTGGNLDVLFLGASGSLQKSYSLGVVPGDPGFFLGHSALADLDGDGTVEILAASGSPFCSGNPASCKGRFFAYRSSDGSLYNDPTWQDASKPQFKVDAYPSSFGGEGYFPLVADLDHDGVAEVRQSMNDGTHVWKFDGSNHPLDKQVSGARLSAPVNDDGTLTDGTLRGLDRVPVDIDGDGTYELIGIGNGGLSVSKGGKPMDGYPVNIGGNIPTVTDLNRDGAVDMLWVGDNNAVNCWTMKGGTYNAARVLHQGGAMGAMSAPGAYPAFTYDPFEPNQPPTAVDLQATHNPAFDFQAFVPYGLRDQFQSGGGWRHSLRSVIGTQGDVDYYWFTNGYTNITVTNDVPSKMTVDLDVFVYIPDGQGGWTYKCEVNSPNITSSGGAYVHPASATGTCPLGINETKGFLVRVKGHDASKDFGPWPYSMQFMWQ